MCASIAIPRVYFTFVSRVTTPQFPFCLQTQFRAIDSL